jgi:outer membrane immunogenic protein
MKKFLLSTVALAGLTAGAVAADLPMRAAPVAVAPAFTWTGFYVGVNAGSGWRNDRNNFFGDPGLVTLDRNGAAGIIPAISQPVVPAAGGFFGQGFGNGTTPLAGFLGGVQAGYNWQLTPGHGWVLGVEGDIQVSNIGRRNNNDNGGFLGNGFGAFGTPGLGTGFGGFQAAAVTPQQGAGFGVSAATAAATPNNIALFNNFGNGNGFNNRNRNGADWFGTARVRVGYAVDRILFYGTAGIAFADDNRNNNNGFGLNGFGTGFATGAAVVAAAPAFFTSAAAVTAAGGVIPTNTVGFFGNRNNNNGNVGGAIGAGVEYAWTNNLSVKFEGMGLLFGNRNGNNNNNAFAFGNQVVGVTNNGAPITATNSFNTGRRGTSSSDIWLLRTGLNYRFGLF